MSSDVLSTGLSILGVKNPIIIEHPKFDIKDLKITIDNGRLSKFKNNTAIIPDRLGVCSVELNDPSGELLSKASFIVKHLPDPYPFINNQYQNEVSSKIFRVIILNFSKNFFHLFIFCFLNLLLYFFSTSTV